MTLLDVTLLLIVGFVFFLFWQSRGISESAVSHVSRYCDTHQLQMLSVSRLSRKMGMVRGKPGWHSVYQFEFSGNQEDKYTGTISMMNTQAKHIDVPAYRVQ